MPRQHPIFVRLLATVLAAAMILTMPGMTGWAVQKLPPNAATQPSGLSPSQSYVPLVGQNGTSSQTMQTAGSGYQIAEALMSAAAQFVNVTQKGLTQGGAAGMQNVIAQAAHTVVAAGGSPAASIETGSASQGAINYLNSYLKDGSVAPALGVHVESAVMGDQDFKDDMRPAGVAGVTAAANSGPVNASNDGAAQLKEPAPLSPNVAALTALNQGGGTAQGQANIQGEYQKLVDSYKQVYIDAKAEWLGLNNQFSDTNNQIKNLDDQINKNQTAIDKLNAEIKEYSEQFTSGQDGAESIAAIIASDKLKIDVLKHTIDQINEQLLGSSKTGEANKDVQIGGLSGFAKYLQQKKEDVSLNQMQPALQQLQVFSRDQMQGTYNFWNPLDLKSSQKAQYSDASKMPAQYSANQTLDEAAEALYQSKRVTKSSQHGSNNGKLWSYLMPAEGAVLGGVAGAVGVATLGVLGVAGAIVAWPITVVVVAATAGGILGTAIGNSMDAQNARSNVNTSKDIQLAAENVKNPLAQSFEKFLNNENLQNLDRKFLLNSITNGTTQKFASALHAASGMTTTASQRISTVNSMVQQINAGQPGARAKLLQLAASWEGKAFVSQWGNLNSKDLASVITQTEMNKANQSFNGAMKADKNFWTLYQNADQPRIDAMWGIINQNATSWTQSQWDQLPYLKETNGDLRLDQWGIPIPDPADITRLMLQSASQGNADVLTVAQANNIPIFLPDSGSLVSAKQLDAILADTSPNGAQAIYTYGNYLNGLQIDYGASDARLPWNAAAAGAKEGWGTYSGAEGSVVGLGMAAWNGLQGGVGAAFGLILSPMDLVKGIYIEDKGLWNLINDPTSYPDVVRTESGAAQVGNNMFMQAWFGDTAINEVEQAFGLTKYGSNDSSFDSHMQPDSMGMFHTTDPLLDRAMNWQRQYTTTVTGQYMATGGDVLGMLNLNTGNSALYAEGKYLNMTGRQGGDALQNTAIANYALNTAMDIAAFGSINGAIEGGIQATEAAGLPSAFGTAAQWGLVRLPGMQFSINVAGGITHYFDGNTAFQNGDLMAAADYYGDATTTVIGTALGAGLSEGLTKGWAAASGLNAEFSGQPVTFFGDRLLTFINEGVGEGLLGGARILTQGALTYVGGDLIPGFGSVVGVVGSTVAMEQIAKNYQTSAQNSLNEQIAEVAAGERAPSDISIVKPTLLERFAGASAIPQQIIVDQAKLALALNTVDRAALAAQPDSVVSAPNPDLVSAAAEQLAPRLVLASDGSVSLNGRELDRANAVVREALALRDMQTGSADVRLNTALDVVNRARAAQEDPAQVAPARAVVEAAANVLAPSLRTAVDGSVFVGNQKLNSSNPVVLAALNRNSGEPGLLGQVRTAYKDAVDYLNTTRLVSQTGSIKVGLLLPFLSGSRDEAQGTAPSEKPTAPGVVATPVSAHERTSDAPHGTETTGAESLRLQPVVEAVAGMESVTGRAVDDALAPIQEAGKLAQLTLPLSLGEEDIQLPLARTEGDLGLRITPAESTGQLPEEPALTTEKQLALPGLEPVEAKAPQSLDALTRNLDEAKTPDEKRAAADALAKRYDELARQAQDDRHAAILTGDKERIRTATEEALKFNLESIKTQMRALEGQEGLDAQAKAAQLRVEEAQLSQKLGLTVPGTSHSDWADEIGAREQASKLVDSNRRVQQAEALSAQAEAAQRVADAAAAKAQDALDAAKKSGEGVERAEADLNAAKDRKTKADIDKNLAASRADFYKSQRDVLTAKAAEDNGESLTRANEALRQNEARLNDAREEWVKNKARTADYDRQIESARKTADNDGLDVNLRAQARRAVSTLTAKRDLALMRARGVDPSSEAYLRQVQEVAYQRAMTDAGQGEYTWADTLSKRSVTDLWSDFRESRALRQSANEEAQLTRMFRGIASALPKSLLDRSAWMRSLSEPDVDSRLVRMKFDFDNGRFKFELTDLGKSELSDQAKDDINRFNTAILKFQDVSASESGKAFGLRKSQLQSLLQAVGMPRTFIVEKTGGGKTKVITPAMAYLLKAMYGEDIGKIVVMLPDTNLLGQAFGEVHPLLSQLGMHPLMLTGEEDMSSATFKKNLQDAQVVYTTRDVMKQLKMEASAAGEANVHEKEAFGVLRENGVALVDEAHQLRAVDLIRGADGIILSEADPEMHQALLTVDAALEEMRLKAEVPATYKYFYRDYLSNPVYLSDDGFTRNFLTEYAAIRGPQIGMNASDFMRQLSNPQTPEMSAEVNALNAYADAISTAHRSENGYGLNPLWNKDPALRKDPKALEGQIVPISLGKANGDMRFGDAGTAGARQIVGGRILAEAKLWSPASANDLTARALLDKAFTNGDSVRVTDLSVLRDFTGVIEMSGSADGIIQREALSLGLTPPADLETRGKPIAKFEKDGMSPLRDEQINPVEKQAMADKAAELIKGRRVSVIGIESNSLDGFEYTEHLRQSLMDPNVDSNRVVLMQNGDVVDVYINGELINTASSQNLGDFLKEPEVQKEYLGKTLGADQSVVFMLDQGAVTGSDLKMPFMTVSDAVKSLQKLADGKGWSSLSDKEIANLKLDPQTWGLVSGKEIDVDAIKTRRMDLQTADIVSRLLNGEPIHDNDLKQVLANLDARPDNPAAQGIKKILSSKSSFNADGIDEFAREKLGEQLTPLARDLFAGTEEIEGTFTQYLREGPLFVSVFGEDTPLKRMVQTLGRDRGLDVAAFGYHDKAVIVMRTDSYSPTANATDLLDHASVLEYKNNKEGFYRGFTTDLTENMLTRFDHMMDLAQSQGERMAVEAARRDFEKNAGRNDNIGLGQKSKAYEALQQEVQRLQQKFDTAVAGVRKSLSQTNRDYAAAASNDNVKLAFTGDTNRRAFGELTIAQQVELFNGKPLLGQSFSDAVRSIGKALNTNDLDFEVGQQHRTDVTAVQNRILDVQDRLRANPLSVNPAELLEIQRAAVLAVSGLGPDANVPAVVGLIAALPPAPATLRDVLSPPVISINPVEPNFTSAGWSERTGAVFGTMGHDFSQAWSQSEGVFGPSLTAGRYAVGRALQGALSDVQRIGVLFKAYEDSPGMISLPVLLGMARQYPAVVAAYLTPSRIQQISLAVAQKTASSREGLALQKQTIQQLTQVRIVAGTAMLGARESAPGYQMQSVVYQGKPAKRVVVSSADPMVTFRAIQMFQSSLAEGKTVLVELQGAAQDAHQAWVATAQAVLRNSRVTSSSRIGIVNTLGVQFITPIGVNAHIPASKYQSELKVTMDPIAATQSAINRYFGTTPGMTFDFAGLSELEQGMGSLDDPQIQALLKTDPRMGDTMATMRSQFDDQLDALMEIAQILDPALQNGLIKTHPRFREFMHVASAGDPIATQAALKAYLSAPESTRMEIATQWAKQLGIPVSVAKKYGARNAPAPMRVKAGFLPTQAAVEHITKVLRASLSKKDMATRGQKIIADVAAAVKKASDEKRYMSIQETLDVAKQSIQDTLGVTKQTAQDSTVGRLSKKDKKLLVTLDVKMAFAKVESDLVMKAPDGTTLVLISDDFPDAGLPDLRHLAGLDEVLLRTKDYQAFMKALADADTVTHQAAKDDFAKVFTTSRKSFATRAQTLQASSAIAMLGLKALIALGTFHILTGGLGTVLVSALSLPAMWMTYKQFSGRKSPSMKQAPAHFVLSPGKQMIVSLSIVLASIAAGSLLFGAPLMGLLFGSLAHASWFGIAMTVGSSLMGLVMAGTMGGSSLDFMLGARQHIRDQSLRDVSAAQSTEKPASPPDFSRVELNRSFALKLFIGATVLAAAAVVIFSAPLAPAVGAVVLFGLSLYFGSTPTKPAAVQANAGQPLINGLPDAAVAPVSAAPQFASVALTPVTGANSLPALATVEKPVVDGLPVIPFTQEVVAPMPVAAAAFKATRPVNEGLVRPSVKKNPDPSTPAVPHVSVPTVKKSGASRWITSPAGRMTALSAILFLGGVVVSGQVLEGTSAAAVGLWGTLTALFASPEALAVAVIAISLVVIRYTVSFAAPRVRRMLPKFQSGIETQKTVSAYGATA